MRRYLSFVVTVLVVMLLLPGAAVAKNAKVDVCHLTGNGSFKLITVSETALPAHLGHGDILVGDGVTSDCEAIPGPEVVVTGEFFNPVGSTVADSDGLTYSYDGSVWTDPNLVYAEEFWDAYPLYLPGGDVQAGVYVENIGTETEDLLTLRAIMFVLNLDGSRRPTTPPSLPLEMSFSLDSGGTVLLPIDVQVPQTAKQLLVFEVYLYDGDPADDQLLYHLDMIFCPPEMT